VPSRRGRCNGHGAEAPVQSKPPTRSTYLLLLVPDRKRGLVVLTNGSAGGPILLAALNASQNKNAGLPRIQYFFEDRARD
jgi:hypothetical protein